MVRIVDFKERKSEKGTFYTLELQGDIEFVVSKETGRMYATAQKCSIPSTFDADTCSALKGKTMKGSIIKMPCDEYEYVIKDTGEVISLNYRYEYSPIEQGSMEDVVHNTPSYALN